MDSKNSMSFADSKLSAKPADRLIEEPIIKGYIHPTKPNSNRGKYYKTFSEGKKAKKREKFGKTCLNGQYSQLGDSKTDDYSCPLCKELTKKVCHCGYNDKSCSNGHTWYTDRNGKVKIGSPH